MEAKALNLSKEVLHTKVIHFPRAHRDERRIRLRTFRFSESLERSLEKEAANEGTNVNALVNSMVSRPA